MPGTCFDSTMFVVKMLNGLLLSRRFHFSKYNIPLITQKKKYNMSAWYFAIFEKKEDLENKMIHDC